jgi:hypothetical protein
VITIKVEVCPSGSLVVITFPSSKSLVIVELGSGPSFSSFLLIAIRSVFERAGRTFEFESGTKESYSASV